MSAKNAVVSKYYSGQGIVLIAKRDANGKPLGFRNVGNVSDLTISVKTDTIEHKESSTGVRGVDLRLTTGITCEVKMMMEAFNRENLMAALRGSGSTVTGASVTDEAIVSYKGMTIPLANMNITTFTSLKSEDGLTTYVAGTDYTVNEEVGSINILPGTAIVDGDVLNASYTFGTYESVDAMTEAAEDLFIRFEGLNTADGNNPVVVEVFKFQPDPLKELALINNQIGSFEVAGNALADLTRPAGTSNYFKEMFVA